MTLIRGRIRLGSAHTKSTIARRFSCFPPLSERAADPRIRELGRLIEDDYASVRANYGTSIISKDQLSTHNGQKSLEIP